MKTLKRDIVADCSRFAARDQSVLSLFIVGSMAKDEIPHKSAYDFDLRIVVDRVTPQLMIEWESFIISLEPLVKQAGFFFSQSNVIGPVRYLTDLPSVMIHWIPFTPESLDELPTTHRISYARNYEILYGTDFIEKYAELALNKDDILDCTEGLRYCRKQIIRRRYKAQVWQDIADECILVKFEREMTDAELFEMCQYAVNKTIHNIKELLSLQGFLTDTNDIHIFDSIIQQIGLSDTNQNICLEMLNGSIYNREIDVNDLSNSAIDILNALEVFVLSL